MKGSNMNPQDVMMYGHLTVVRTVDSFPREHVYASGAVGYWSVKDVIAHLGSFELVLVELLGSLIEPCPTPLVDEFKGDGQAFNDRQVDVLRKNMSMEQAMHEYTSAYEQVATLARQIPRSTWQTNGILPWYGDQYDLEDFVVYTFYAHKREHCGQIQVFRDQFVKLTST
jgi:hypothetical protein